MKKITSALLLLAVFAAPAMAAEPGRFYGSIDLGRWNMKDSNFPDPGVFVVTGGFQIAPQFAVELGLYGAGESVVYYPGSGSQIANQSAFTAAAVGTLPINERFQLFGKLGASFITAKITGTGAYAGTYTKETTTNAVVGLGGQINFTKRFGMRLQYEALGKSKASPTDPGVDVTVSSIGLTYNF